MKNQSSILAALQNARKAEFDYCANNLSYWCNNYCVIEDKDAPEVIVPFKAWEAQEEILRDFELHRLNIILKARQMGITWISLFYCIHDLMFNLGHTVVALSKTEDDAKELVRRVSVVLDNMPELLAGNKLRWTHTTTVVKVYTADSKLVSTFKSFPASEGAGRSFTANIVLLDEWAFQQYAREIWTSAYPTINRPTGGKVIGLSTIKRGTLFEELWTADNNFNKIFLGCFSDPRRTQEWYQQAAKDLGSLVKQEYPRTAEEALSNIGGAFFSEFDYSVHTCISFNIPEDWTIYNAMDYGLDMLAHYRIAVDNWKNVYVFHEIYASGLIVSDAASRIKLAELKESSNGEVEPWYPPKERLAPPDLWSNNPQTGKSIQDAFDENGLDLIQVSNNRESGWLQVKELLKLMPQADGSVLPRLRIFRTCINLIRTMQQILTDEKNPKDCAKMPHELTHAPDALRYFAVYWTSGPKVAEQKKVRYTSDQLEDYRNASSQAERDAIIKRYGVPQL